MSLRCGRTIFLACAPVHIVGLTFPLFKEEIYSGNEQLVIGTVVVGDTCQLEEDMATS